VFIIIDECHNLSKKMLTDSNNEINKLRINHKNFYKYTNFIYINLIGIIIFTMIYYIID
jgi:hypothetical protein